MKKLLPFLLFILLLSCNHNDNNKATKLMASTCEGRGCSGDEYCSACKNCTGCKNCAKEGGTCGVCAPAAAAPKAKKPKSKKR